MLQPVFQPRAQVVRRTCETPCDLPGSLSSKLRSVSLGYWATGPLEGWGQGYLASRQEWVVDRLPFQVQRHGLKGLGEMAAGYWMCTAIQECSVSQMAEHSIRSFPERAALVEINFDRPFSLLLSEASHQHILGCTQAYPRRRVWST